MMEAGAVGEGVSGNGKSMGVMCRKEIPLETPADELCVSPVDQFLIRWR